MDDAGDSIQAANAGWSFGGDVSENFDAHVEKSVPFYHEGHDLVVKLSDFFLNDGSMCYELGCSTGALSHLILKRNEHKDVKCVGIDLEVSMIEKARQRCSDQDKFQGVVSDILDIEFESADLIVAYYTMQFTRTKHRQRIFDRIYQALNWGGAFVLFEKVRAPDARFQDMMTAIYTDYKIDQGYQAEEIVAKARSLKGVLEPFSTQGNYDLLKRAGFVDMMTVMKYVSFEGVLAIK